MVFFGLWNTPLILGNGLEPTISDRVLKNSFKHDVLSLRQRVKLQRFQIPQPLQECLMVSLYKGICSWLYACSNAYNSSSDTAWNKSSNGNGTITGTLPTVNLAAPHYCWGPQLPS